jgi:Fe-S cluster biogenesis protein NfuA
MNRKAASRVAHRRSAAGHVPGLVSHGGHLMSQHRRAAAAMVGICALALVGACSGSPSSAGSGGSQIKGESASSSNAGGSANAPLVAFSRCVRSHGVANFPDPQAGASNAKFPSAQQLRVSSSQLSAAESACQHLLPVGVDDQFPQSEVPLLLRGMLPFSSCMRSHGVPNFPDPAVDSEGRPIFPLSTHGISLNYSHSQQFNTAVGKCQNLAPRQLGGIPFG